jgi:hypothetical protein
VAPMAAAIANFSCTAFSVRIIAAKGPAESKPTTPITGDLSIARIYDKWSEPMSFLSKATFPDTRHAFDASWEMTASVLCPSGGTEHSRPGACVCIDRLTDV